MANAHVKPGSGLRDIAPRYLSVPPLTSNYSTNIPIPRHNKEITFSELVIETSRRQAIRGINKFKGLKKKPHAGTQTNMSCGFNGIPRHQIMLQG